MSETIFWTPQRIETMTRLWDEGQSASEIAQAIGAVSRSSVCGKIFRLGLSRPRAVRTKQLLIFRPKPPKVSSPKPEPKPRATNNLLAVNVARRAVAPTAPLPKAKPDGIAIAPRPWISRAFGECAYSVAGDGADTLSCCNPTEARYCAPHRKLMVAKQVFTNCARKAIEAGRAYRERLKGDGNGA